ncbi:hypothetical protein IQ07DRAFT_592957 [Pyrenochaeta sp. DS3sAY3a]|nr:hypothetical protein IQ07DRAFT_592957 [Pyrenochaeta sp. DS3sAY3a]
MQKAPNFARALYSSLRNNDNATDTKANTSRRHILDDYGWTWEIAAVVASFGSLAAVVAILSTMESQASSRWTFFISLNATVAVFITAAKSLALLAIGACISQAKWIHFRRSRRRLEELELFESASRGPLGSVVLLSRVRWTLTLASVGAIATILAVGVDAFAQQVIDFDTRGVETMDGHAVFGLGHFFKGNAKWSKADINVGDAFNVDPASISPKMQGAVFRGIVEDTTTPSFKCNGNCVWKDAYWSLGIGSHCSNVTTTSKVIHRPGKAWEESLNITTPAGIEFSVDRSTKILVANNGTIPWWREGPYQGHLIKNRTTIRFPPEVGVFAIARTLLPFDGSLPPLKFETHECVVSLEAHKYTNIKTNGANIDLTLERFPLGTGTFRGPNPEVSDKLGFRGPGTPDLYIKSQDLVALNFILLSRQFSGSLRDDDGLLSVPAEGAGVAFINRSISAAFDNMAASLSDYLRANSKDSAEGFSLVPEVYVRVFWPWLTLPIVVTVVAAFCVAGTMISSRMHACAVWKSSAIAILHHYVDFKDTKEEEESVGLLKTDYKDLQAMDQMAKQTKVTLE